jgi:protein tyrosine/serine phosphatase
MMIKDWLSSLFIDHGILRLIYANRFRLAGGLFRSNQPSPGQIRRLSLERGLRSVINLRGADAQKHGFHRLERRACDDGALRLVDVTIWSRGLLSKEQIQELARLISAVELPALAHCKSGADRAGFFSVLYRHIRLGEPIEVAMEELSWRYGHFASAPTGVLDHFFRTYLEQRRPHQGFMEWVAHDYDRDAVQSSFKPRGLSRWMVDTVLRRE